MTSTHQYLIGTKLGFHFSGLILPGPIIVYGGIRPYPQRARNTENKLVGESHMDKNVSMYSLEDII